MGTCPQCRDQPVPDGRRFCSDTCAHRRARADYKTRNRAKIRLAKRTRRNRRYATDPAFRHRHNVRMRSIYETRAATTVDTLCEWCGVAPARRLSRFCSRRCRYEASSARQYRGGPRSEAVLAARARRRAHILAFPAITEEQIESVRERCGRRCVYCGGPGETIDHVIPLARGGEHAPDNLALACWVCNRTKNDRTPIEFLKRPAPWLFGSLS